MVTSFGLQHALVLAAGAGVGRRLGIGRVLPGQDAARERTVGDDAESVIGAGSTSGMRFMAL